MKMAKASEADLAMAMKLANYLDAIERGQMPDELSEDEEAIEWLDERDTDQYAKLLDGLRRLLNQGSISRVIWGMAVICDPANEIIDPDAGTLEAHPRLDAAANDAERYRWLRERLMAADFDWQDSGECALVFAWPKDCAVSGNCDATIDGAMLKTHNAKSEGAEPLLAKLPLD